jgi:hypothetical protein
LARLSAQLACRVSQQSVQQHDVGVGLTESSENEPRPGSVNPETVVTIRPILRDTARRHETRERCLRMGVTT